MSIFNTIPRIPKITRTGPMGTQESISSSREWHKTERMVQSGSSGASHTSQGYGFLESLEITWSHPFWDILIKSGNLFITSGNLLILVVRDISWLAKVYLPVFRWDFPSGFRSEGEASESSLVLSWQGFWKFWRKLPIPRAPEGPLKNCFTVPWSYQIIKAKFDQYHCKIKHAPRSYK
jgi:hypothetical protein